MGMTKRTLFRRLQLVALSVAIVTLAGAASADVKRSQRTKDGDFHEFGDDLLNSDVAFPRGGSIVVRPPPMRSLLIRPRANFVPEMLKSIENI
jgi:hypothetical protein